jgi:hypothetical protein
MSVDYACFAIWEHGREKEQEIIADLKARFDILGNFLVFWSEAHYVRNIARLYESNSGTGPFKGYDKKIGRPPFRFLIVRDNSPKYAWKKSVSGAIEPSNAAVVEKKYLYRSWIKNGYQVHSSNNHAEFFLQAPLVLGSELFEKALAGTVGNAEIQLHKDLEGAEGWSDWESLFRMLNYANDYVVLRGFESLPGSLAEGDLDFLTSNFQRLASSANVWQSEKAPYKGNLKVADRTLHVDMHFVGDEYYPAAWAKDLLQRKSTYNGFSVPSKEDLFFSLFYHCAVHKTSFKGTHKQTLMRIAKDCGFDWFSPDVFENVKLQTELLAGYMRACNYFYTQSVDKKIYVNARVSANLPSARKIFSTPARRLFTKVKRAFRRMPRRRQT